MTQTVLITGGTGLVGKTLSKALIKKGYQIIILTRNTADKKAETGLTYAEWNVAKQQIDMAALQRADYIVHLAGAGVVEKKWTAAYKREIVESRTESSRLIYEALKNNTNKVKAIVSASATGWYGADAEPAKPFVETDPADEDFLGQTCYEWEQSIHADSSLPIRVCNLRTGIVLSNDGGALKAFKNPIRFGIGAILGNGKQMISWIHIEDLCRLFIYALENNSMTGPYNAVSTSPVSNKELTLALARALKGSYFIPVHVPGFVLKLMLGKSSVEVLKSTTVSNHKVKEAGFTFLYPTIESAILELTGRRS